MTETSRAVFLSYASQDARAAQRICDALRAGGVEVWLDTSELRGGDAWDRQIRERIHDCRLFIAVISAHTEARDEGYFRHEWKLAVERTHHMADNKPFLVPVVIDDTRERGSSVPDKLQEVQWTRLPGGDAPPAFVERVRRLLSPDGPYEAPAVAVSLTPSTVQPSEPSVAPRWRSNVGLWAIGAVIAAALAAIVVDRLLVSRHSPPPFPPAAPSAQAAAPAAIAPAFNPPAHSIAVLPFLNMSGDKEQEYFSEGLTEELLNSLATINQLQVAARTSSFSFQGQHADIATVARKLNVAAVLEGSVRRSAHTVRVTAQLVNGTTGFHLWSQTYDRNLGDVLKLQTEIATSVASALKVSLLGDESTKIEVGGTRNPAAQDAYLRASKAYWTLPDTSSETPVIAVYTEAINMDPAYALAYAARSFAEVAQSYRIAAPANMLEQAHQDARKAIELAPGLAEGHLALAVIHDMLLEYGAANEEFKRALALAPGNTRVLRNYGIFAVRIGLGDSGLAMVRRAVELDPLNVESYAFLGNVLADLRRGAEAIEATRHADVLAPGCCSSDLGFDSYLLGDFDGARSACEQPPADEACLAVAYMKLGRHADAESAMARLRAARGDDAAYQYAQINAQWGNTSKAVEWLETAVRLRNGDLGKIRTDYLLDPLRKAPRFQAIERELKFPTD